METKRVIRHAVLNLLTVISMTLTEKHISHEAKKKADDYVKLIALLISHEGIFLNEKPKFLKRKMDLNFTLDLVRCIYVKEIEERKIKLVLPKGECFIKADSHYIKEALQQIFRKLLYVSDEITLDFNKKTNELTIKWKSNSFTEVIKKDLVKCLDDVDQDNGREIAFQLSLELLKLHGTPCKTEKNKISIAFK